MKTFLNVLRNYPYIDNKKICLIRNDCPAAAHTVKVGIAQLSHLYMTTGKTIALTRQTFVDKVMSLCFNMLSRLVITSLPKSIF